ncbi:hypothetical protein B0H16DRAFT_1720980 [Mycena metata]|uniref:INO80 complex subunit B-like conserved region domain-containing protein n=1 Tax=Mycena metata TaxID=1033252 RepID=A0AAD7NG30_9AGAR|nr:hypothetical protein B0H16DRAFT_1720980 [Mycena metata]
MPAAVASEESEVDIEVEEMQLDSSDEEDENKEEEEAGEDELEESDGERESVAGTNRTSGPLKIKLKLGAQPESSSKAPSGRRFAHRAKNEDVESEDSESNSNSDDEQNFPYGTAPGRQLTARQAALASAGDTDHVSLGMAYPSFPPSPFFHPSLYSPRTTLRADTTPAPTPKRASNKNKTASASEVALRKEENARKRKNMIEKKLEDEKAETINRLLKKQSRPKKQRTTAQAQQVQSDGEEGDEEGGEDAAGGHGYGGAEQKPMFRWVSSARRPPVAAVDMKDADADAMAVDLEEAPTPPVASITFSVPESFLLIQSASGQFKTEEEDAKPVLATPARCAVDGCGGLRKYRAVGKAWGIGACGLGHLRVLEGRI